MKKNLLISSLLIILFLASYLIFSYIRNNNAILSPEQVINNYFESRNSKVITKAEQYLVEANRNTIDWNIENQEYIRIIEITDAEDSSLKEGYLKKIGDIKPFEVKCYLVKYEVKYKNENVEPLESGIQESYYILIKEKARSHWLIAEWGF